MLLLALDDTGEPDLRNAIVAALMGNPDEDPWPACDPALASLDKVGCCPSAGPVCFALETRACSNCLGQCMHIVLFKSHAILTELLHTAWRLPCSDQRLMMRPPDFTGTCKELLMNICDTGNTPYQGPWICSGYVVLGRTLHACHLMPRSHGYASGMPPAGGDAHVAAWPGAAAAGSALALALTHTAQSWCAHTSPCWHGCTRS